MVKVAFDPNKSAQTIAEKPAKKTHQKKKSHWFLKFSVLTVVAVVAAPSVLSLTGSVPTVIRKANPKLADAVSFGSLNMHWWAPVEITNLKVLDLSLPLEPGTIRSKAPLLCEVERITTIEPLWRIALNTGRGTGVLVKSPRLTLIADAQGTNLDRTSAEIFGKLTVNGSDRFPFRVIIEDGAAQLVSAPFANISEPTSIPANVSNEATGPNADASVIAHVSNINGTFSTMDTSRWLPAMKLSASIQQTTPQRVTQRMVTRSTRIAAQLDSLVNDFPDVPLEHLVGTDASGDANAARIQIYLQPHADDQGRQAIQIGARDVDLRLMQPFLSMLGIEASCTGMISGGIDARLAGAELKDGLVGKIMLAGDDVRIRQSQWAPNEWLPLGRVNANGAIAIAEDGMLIQDLVISSDIAELTGNGELRHNRRTAIADPPTQSQQIELIGSVDLARLASSLRKTLALHEDVTVQTGKFVFEARGSADAADHRDSTVAIAGNAVKKGSWQIVARADGLQAVRAGQPLKVDSKIRLEAVGPFVAGIPDLTRARLTADFGTIDCVPERGTWKISGLVQPASLWQTLRQFADMAQPGIRGDVQFETHVSMQHNEFRLTGLQLNSTDVKVSSAALAITPSNPVMSMLDGSVHVEGSGAAIRTLLMPWLDASFLAEYSQVVADLSASAKRDLHVNVRIAPTGVATIQRGKVLSVSKTQTSNQGQMTYAPASVFVIDEADVNLNITASNSGNQFDVTDGTVTLPGLTARVTGTVSVPADTTILDLTADASYDLDVLSRRLFAADSGLSFSGQGRDVFKLKGDPSQLSGVARRKASSTAPATSRNALEGSGGLKWASANIMGLSVGEASTQLALENSLLRMVPIQCSLNGGQLNAMAQYDIASSRLQLGSGSRVENVQVTQELCREWLSYVAPMMADAAEVSGHLSMRVERFLWDLNAPRNSDVAGQLTIHQASATPGSSFASLLQVVDLLRKRDETNGFASRSLTLPEQTVPIQVRQGYVIHEGLIMDLAGYRLRSSGGVGLNEQIQINLDVPLEKGTSGSVRSVKVPLRGTVKNPQPDTSSLLQNFGAQKLQEKLGIDKIQEKIGNDVDETLNKRLNKLLDRF